MENSVRFLKKLNMEWLYDPALLLQGVHPKGKQGLKTDVYTAMFTYNGQR